MQLSMLVLWLLELMLRKLGSLKDAGIQPDNPQYRTSWDVLNRFTEQKRIMVQSSKAVQIYKTIVILFGIGMYPVKLGSCLQSPF